MAVASATVVDLVSAGDTLLPFVERYIGGRVRRGELQPITARTMRTHLYRLVAVYGRRPLDKLGPRTVERLIETMQSSGLAPATQSANLSPVRNFSRWMVAAEHIPRDFTVGAPRIRRPRHIPRDMESCHALAMIAHAQTDRERLIVWLMFGCGLRCVEVSRLMVDDLDPNGLLFVTGKGGHQRVVPAPPPVVRAWHAYLDSAGHRAGSLIRKETDGTGPVSAERISGIAGRLVRDAGVKVRAGDGRSAHGLRAAAASDLFEACGDLGVVQQFLGHANIATTSVYLRRANTEAIRAGQDARHL